MPLRLRVISENRKILGDECIREFAGCGGTIGRSLDNDWVLPDPKRYVSSRHALIDFQRGVYYLVDTSRNGVYVNDADSPVGRGHPQRLFDGDQIRLGEFDILAEVSEDVDAVDDGMGDSVVRAQQVPEDESLELALVADSQMIDDVSLVDHLIADESAKLNMDETGLTGKNGGATAEQAALLLAKAAGLKPQDIAGVPPSDLLETAGQLLRVMVTGLMDLLHDRAKLKESFRLSQTIIRAEPNNPLKFSPVVDDAMRYLLGDRSDTYLPAEEAVANVIKDIKAHEQAMSSAMLEALSDYVDRFDPDELRSQFDRGLKRGSLLAGANKLKYWDLYAESYQILTQHQDGKLPEEFSKEFVRAYEEQVSKARHQRTPDSA